VATRKASGEVLAAGVPMGCREFVGDAGRIVGLDHFGASAAYTVLYEKFGLTAGAVVAAARESLAAAKAPPAAPVGPDGAGVPLLAIADPLVDDHHA
jgi:transketolase